MKIGRLRVHIWHELETGRQRNVLGLGLKHAEFLQDIFSIALLGEVITPIYESAKFYSEVFAYWSKICHVKLSMKLLFEPWIFLFIPSWEKQIVYV
jgi:hypothetical protein